MAASPAIVVESLLAFVTAWLSGEFGAGAWGNVGHNLKLNVKTRRRWQLDLPTRGCIVDLVWLRMQVYFGGAPAIIKTVIDELDGIFTNYRAVILPVLR